jgi:flagellar assembly protein FliH
MGQARKFLFDVSFDNPESPADDARRPVEPTFSQAELDAARGEGFSLGRTAALAEASAATEAKIAESCQALKNGIERLFAERDEIHHEAERAAIALMREVLRQAVPALCRKEAFAELEALVARCLAESLSEPRMVVRVNDALFDAMQKRLGALSQTNGFAGKIVLLADDSLSPDGGRIEWADGGAERDPQRMITEIDAALGRVLAATPEPPRPFEEIING